MLFLCRKLLYKISIIFFEIFFVEQTLQNPYENIMRKEHFLKRRTDAELMEDCRHFNNRVNCFNACAGFQAPKTEPHAAAEFQTSAEKNYFSL